MHEYGGITHENYGSLRMWQIKALLGFLERRYKDDDDDELELVDEQITKVR